MLLLGLQAQKKTLDQLSLGFLCWDFRKF